MTGGGSTASSPGTETGVRVVTDTPCALRASDVIVPVLIGNNSARATPAPALINKLGGYGDLDDCLLDRCIRTPHCLFTALMSCYANDAQGETYQDRQAQYR
jgi:hypothetical protein